MLKMHKNFPVWTPHVTVAAIVARQFGDETRFLMVREETRRGIKINQPAGHWEAEESLTEAVQREVLEESGYAFTPSALLGIYVSDRWDKDITYLRFTFIGTVGEHPVRTQLDEGILSAEWLTYDEIMANEAIHRNAIVAQCLRDYQAGQRIDMDLMKDLRAKEPNS